MTTDNAAQDTPQAGSDGSQAQPSNQGQADGNQDGPAKTALSNASQGDNPQGDPTKAQPDAQKADPNSKDGEGQDKDKDEPKGAPDKYEDFKLPENMELDVQGLEQFSTMAKEANLPQDVAQKFVTMGAEAVSNAVENYHAHITEAYAQKVEGWHTTRAKDTEIGGTEQAQNAVLAAGAKVIGALGGESLMKALDETGAGNHPEVIRAFFRLKDLVGEDGKLITNNKGGGAPKTPAQAIYPNLPSIE